MTEANAKPRPPRPDVAPLLADARAVLDRPVEAAWWVPGRIELLGKHVDYCGGVSLVCATDRGIAVAAARHDDRRIVVHSCGQTCTVIPGAPSDVTGWGGYVTAVVQRLSADFPQRAGGVEISLAGNLPPAAGLSSSSALVVGLCEAIAWAWRLADDSRGSFLEEPTQRFTYWSCMESGRPFGLLAGGAGVGTSGGSQDHAAIGMAKPGCATAFAYDPLRCLGAEPLPAGYRLAVLHTGVVAEKTGSARAKYNRCAELVAEALVAWNRRAGRSDRNLAVAVDAVGSQVLLDALEGDLRRRAEHFLVESDCVAAARRALQQGDDQALAESVRRSGEAADRLLGNQVPQTMFAIAAAMDCGALAASPFGAGFGGAVWAMFPQATLEQGLAGWQSACRREFPADASHAFAVAAADPLARLDPAAPE
jgi:galactokinase